MVNSDDLIVRLFSSNFITCNSRIIIRCLKAGWVVMRTRVMLFMLVTEAE